MISPFLHFRQLGRHFDGFCEKYTIRKPNSYSFNLARRIIVNYKNQDLMVEREASAPTL